MLPIVSFVSLVASAGPVLSTSFEIIFAEAAMELKRSLFCVFIFSDSMEFMLVIEAEIAILSLPMTLDGVTTSYGDT